MAAESSLAQQPEFSWPEGKRAAISVTFDDARPSQVDRGVPILDVHGVKGTFYVSLRYVEARLEAWREALANGHEIGSHTLSHPCSANFPFARGRALEDYTLERMEEDLTRANDAIEELLGVQPVTFAYPCGQKFVGRGEGVKSYVPLVARHFKVGRGAYDEVHNAPAYCDLAQAFGVEADRADFERLKGLVDNAVAEGGWLILFGHDVGDAGRQAVLAEPLDALCRYAADPANGLWIDTVAAIGTYIIETRKA